MHKNCFFSSEAEETSFQQDRPSQLRQAGFDWSRVVHVMLAASQESRTGNRPAGFVFKQQIRARERKTAFCGRLRGFRWRRIFLRDPRPASWETSRFHWHGCRRSRRPLDFLLRFCSKEKTHWSHRQQLQCKIKQKQNRTKRMTGEWSVWTIMHVAFVHFKFEDLSTMSIVAICNLNPNLHHFTLYGDIWNRWPFVQLTERMKRVSLSIQTRACASEADGWVKVANLSKSEPARLRSARRYF